MTFPNNPGIAGGVEHGLGARALDAREQARVVDMIEAAERSAPYCSCGAHMLAVADESGAIWLECSERERDRDGLAAIYARLTSWTHTRRKIMERPDVG
jgi:hypothetical protein